MELAAPPSTTTASTATQLYAYEDVLQLFETHRTQWDKIYLQWIHPNIIKHIMQYNVYDGETLFLTGLMYEYGINMEQDINKAKELYKQSADTCFTLALYKIAEMAVFEAKSIYGLNKQISTSGLDTSPQQARSPTASTTERNLDLNEVMFMLLKAHAYVDYNEEPKGKSVCSESSSFITKHDPKLEKFNSLLQYMEGKEDPDEIQYVRSQILIRICYKTEALRKKGISILLDLALKKNHKESIYRAAYLSYQQKYKDYISTDLKFSEECFLKCYNMKYYKSYAEYGKFLHEEGRTEKSKELFLEGRRNGYYNCLWPLIILDFADVDFSKLQMLRSRLDLILEHVLLTHTDYYEYLLIRKLLKKHKQYHDEYHDFVEMEMVKSLTERYLECRKQKDFRFTGQICTSYSLALQQHLVTKDLYEQVRTLEEFAKNGTGWVERLYRHLLIKVKKLIVKRTESSAEPDSKLNPEYLAIKSSIQEEQKKLTSIFLNSMTDGEFPTFYYRIAKAYYKQRGVEYSAQNSYVYLCKAVQQLKTKVSKMFKISLTNLYYGQKVVELLEKFKHDQEAMSFKERIQHIVKEEMCPICMDCKGNVVYMGCNHFSCAGCFKLLADNAKLRCPMCRRNITCAVNTDFLP